MSNPINICFPLKSSPNGAFATNNTTLDAITDDLRILILTNHGERPIHYDFGANLRSLIFEHQGAELRDMIDNNIRVAVEKWMPYVNILGIEVYDSSNNSTVRQYEIQIKIKFSVGSIDASRVLLQRVKV